MDDDSFGYLTPRERLDLAGIHVDSLIKDPHFRQRTDVWNRAQQFNHRQTWDAEGIVKRLKRLAQILPLPAPIVWVPSPTALQKLILRFVHGYFRSPQSFRKLLDDRNGGRLDPTVIRGIPLPISGKLITSYLLHEPEDAIRSLMDPRFATRVHRLFPYLILTGPRKLLYQQVGWTKTLDGRLSENVLSETLRTVGNRWWTHQDLKTFFWDKFFRALAVKMCNGPTMFGSLSPLQAAWPYDDRSYDKHQLIWAAMARDCIYYKSGPPSGMMPLLATLRKGLGWLIPTIGGTLAIARPRVYARYDRDESVNTTRFVQFHRADGPAVEWPDGTADYYLHGREIPETEFLRPTLDDIDHWSALHRENLAILMRRIDIGALRRDPRCYVVEETDEGTLFHIHLWGYFREVYLKFLQVTCPSTGEHHLLEVPYAFNDVHGARAWTFEMRPEEFAPLVET